MSNTRGSTPANYAVFDAPRRITSLIAVSLLSACAGGGETDASEPNADNSESSESTANTTGDCDVSYGWGAQLAGDPAAYGVGDNHCTIRVSGDESAGVAAQTFECNVIIAFAHNHYGGEVVQTALSFYYFPPDWRIEAAGTSVSQAQVGFDLQFGDSLVDATPVTLSAAKDGATQIFTAFYKPERAVDGWRCILGGVRRPTDDTFELDIESMNVSCAVEEEEGGERYWWKRYSVRGALRAECGGEDGVPGNVRLEVDF